MITFALEESDQQDLICLVSDLGPRSVFVSMAMEFVSPALHLWTCFIH